MQEYKDVFEPLVLEECCAQILRGVEEGEVLAPHRAVVAASEVVSSMSCAVQQQLAGSQQAAGRQLRARIP